MRWSSDKARGLHRPTTVMITNNCDEVSEASESTGPATAATVLTEEVFLGIDTAKVRHVVARFALGEGAKPAEGMTTATLLARVGKWRKAGAAVHCVYEAGPTGFALARQLLALGATCLVVRPRRLDRHGRRRKTDPLDAQHLAEDLVAHHFGRKGLLRPVRLPSEAEELRRLAVRERETLARVRHQLLNSAKGRALALGYPLPKEWWRPRVLPQLLPAFPAAVARLLTRAAAAGAAIKEQLAAVETELTADAPAAPNGVGALTVGVLEREVCDWQRFKSGRKLSSFCGLCPSEDSSAERHHQGTIDKHGSPRLRFWCQETAWRLFKFQREYRGVIWAREKMREANKSRSKQIAVALARRFLVDWWRVRTGRVTCAELGLVFKKSGTTQ
jgi:transposase